MRVARRAADAATAPAAAASRGTSGTRKARPPASAAVPGPPLSVEKKGADQKAADRDRGDVPVRAAREADEAEESEREQRKVEEEPFVRADEEAPDAVEERVREPLAARVGGKRPPEPNDFEGEHRGERQERATRRGGQRPHTLAARDRGTEEEREQRHGQERQVRHLREDEPARAEAGAGGEAQGRGSGSSRRADGKKHGEDEAHRLERLRESERCVRSERRRDGGPEDREPLAERPGAERARGSRHTAAAVTRRI